jgi:hypothetical protein
MKTSRSVGKMMRTGIMFAAGFAVACFGSDGARADGEIAAMCEQHRLVAVDLEDLDRHVDGQLYDSLALRKMDKDDLTSLITAICDEDIADDGDAAYSWRINLATPTRLPGC